MSCHCHSLYSFSFFPCLRFKRSADRIGVHPVPVAAAHGPGHRRRQPQDHPRRRRRPRHFRRVERGRRQGNRGAGTDGVLSRSRTYQEAFGNANLQGRIFLIL